MNKKALEKFAVAARLELIKKVKIKAEEYGISESDITEKNKLSSDGVFVNNTRLDKVDEKAWDTLVRHIKEINTDDDYKKAYNTVMEEVAYTWFNRFVALRYMENKEYLPTGVRVISSSDGGADPDIIKEALTIDLDIDKEKVYELKQSNESSARDELYKYMVIKQCESLTEILPFLFDKTKDYVRLLFPDNLLGDDSFIGMLLEIEEDSWDKVEVIGWLYQFYISERKDEVFAGLKKNKKIQKEDIAPATQLFTPDWIVQYMIQNSVGKLCEEITSDNNLKDEWEYYIETAKQEEAVESQLKAIAGENSNRSIEEIKILDPSMGSGHILVYAFDLLYEVYLKQGYMPMEIPKLIIEKNLYGIDIDYRASQLAYFVLMMKGREKHRRFFRKSVTPNLIAIDQSNGLVSFEHESGQVSIDDTVKHTANYIIDVFKDAKEYGSIIKVNSYDYDELLSYMQGIKEHCSDDLIQEIWITNIYNRMPQLIKQAKILSDKYDVVCTNPPYMGAKGMNTNLSTYVKKYYPDTKSDLFAVFMELDNNLLKDNGYFAMINQHSWMFLSSYEKYREKMISSRVIDTMLHLGTRTFEEIGGEVVQNTSYVLKKMVSENYKSEFYRLVDFNSSAEKEKKVKEAVQNYDCGYKYTTKTTDFNKIPGSPIAYWASEKIVNGFIGDNISKKCFAGIGMRTGDNERFLRLWNEVSFENSGFHFDSATEAIESGVRWIPYNKGGEFRKWYGNNHYVVNWYNDGFEIKENTRKKYPQLGNNLGWKISNEQYYFKAGITWSGVTTGSLSCRGYNNGFIFDSGANGLFPNCKEEDYFYLGLLNSNYADTILKIINPTINTGAGTLKKIPLEENIKHKLETDKFVKCNVEISKNNWDSFETSWDFTNHPLLQQKTDNILSNAYENYKTFANNDFAKLKENEEELNRIFIDIYGLQDELTPEVEDKDITIHKVVDSKNEVDYKNNYILEKTDVIKSFMSYAVGCMFGRYSLDEDGLAFAGGDFDSSKYTSFEADSDNIIPITDESYYPDDIVDRFVEFVKVTFGETTVNENLDFIAKAIGIKGTEVARDTIRRYFINDFYKDHTSTYKKRPIYWLFTSGKQKAFNALIYMHRYDKTTLARIRTDYLHKHQGALETKKSRLEDDLLHADSTREKKNIDKQLIKIDKQLTEIIEYDEKLHHMADMMIPIELDDGVVVNYAKFDKLLAKIK